MRILTIAILSLYVSGCITSSKTYLPNSSKMRIKSDKHEEACGLTENPSLSISVVRLANTSIDDGEICKKLQDRLKHIFLRTGKFQRIITGDTFDYCDYRLQLVFCEARKENNNPGEAFLHGYFLCTIPLHTEVYDCEYILMYEHGDDTRLASKAFYHRDEYSWLLGLIFGPLTYLSDGGNTDKEILKSLVIDIQNQGGFSKLQLDVK